MCLAANFHLFVTVAVVAEDGHVYAHKSDWAGGPLPPDVNSRANLVGRMKALELLINIDKDIALTPASPLGLGYPGGVRRYWYQEDVYLLTTASKWSGECDLQHALALNFAMTEGVHFHHFGIRYTTEAEMRTAVSVAEKDLGLVAVHLPADDHDRYYLHTEIQDCPCWLEFQYFPNNETYGVHWDMVTAEPVGFFEFIAEHLGKNACIWEFGENDPVGVVWEDNHGTPFGIMARHQWWIPGK